VNVPLGSDDVQRFRGLVGVRLGLHFEDSKLSQLAEVLASRVSESSLPCEAYLGRLAAPELPRDELRVLAHELTVGETYFFRNPDQFRAFSEVALPDRAHAQRLRGVRILSAGCASGEEPYSLAIVLAARAEPSSSASIRAVDLNASALARAAQAHYSPWALRETPAEVQRRWFRQKGRDLVLDEDVRRFVTFEERNLAESDPELWPPEAYDIVFCRNVLMYFTPQNALALVERITRSLAPGGYLFLGHAETLRGLSQEFHLLHTHGTFYYQRHDAASPRVAAHAGLRGEGPLDPTPLLSAVEGGDTWVEAIRRASERIHALAHASERGPARDTPTGRAGRRRPQWDLGSAMELLRAERFGEALDAVQGLPPEAAADPEVLLLRATLLTHNGRLAEAERACEELLEVDELNAGAHYLLALCREGLGDPEGARHQDQIAAYLDAGFAMPRLHMGLLARRAGDRERAGRELAEALDLLRREDGSRLLLFGGGFTREALAALCRAELLACGGTA
jgi:chemotaxis protein methyltransferase CheR